MDRNGKFTAALLDKSTAALASRAVSRLAEGGARDAALVETWGFSRLTSDAAQRLRVLGEALACGRREVFDLDVEWMRATLAARVVEPRLLGAVLEALALELEESLPSESSATAVDWIGTARARVESEPAPAIAEPTRDPAVRRFLLALLEGDRREVTRLALESLQSDGDLGRVHERLLAPAQDDLGRLWQRGDLGVAEEHLASRLVSEVLSVLRQRIQGERGATVLVACVPGNQHDIGAQMVADRLEAGGWRALCLGANMPAVDLVTAVAQVRPAFVALSSGLGLHVRATADTIEMLRSEADTRVPVLVGGRIFSAVEGLWRDVGADAFARDAGDAVKVAERWRAKGA